MSEECLSCGRTKYYESYRCEVCDNKKRVLFMLCARKYDAGCTVFGFPQVMMESVLVHVVRDYMEHAAGLGNVASMEFYLSRGIVPTVRAMVLACKGDHLRAVRFLVDNKLHDCLETALQCSTVYRHDDIFEYVMNNRPLLEETGWKLSSVLFEYVAEGRLDVVKRLMREPDADINCRQDGDVRGDSLLHAALRAIDGGGADGYPIMERLVRNGLNPWVENAEGRNIEHICSYEYYIIPDKWWILIAGLDYDHRRI